MHIGFGLDLLGGDDAFSVGAHLHIHAGHDFGTTAVRPFLAAGLDAESVTLRPRAGAHYAGYDTVGLGAQAGLRFVDGGFADSLLYVSAARFRIDPSQQLRMQLAPGVDASAGMRFAAGATVGDHWIGSIPEANDALGYVRATVMLIVPHAVELAWEHSLGTDRVGVNLGYGF
jgi:hypothetical protein